MDISYNFHKSHASWVFFPVYRRGSRLSSRVDLPCETWRKSGNGWWGFHTVRGKGVGAGAAEAGLFAGRALFLVRGSISSHWATKKPEADGPGWAWGCGRFHSVKEEERSSPAQQVLPQLVCLPLPHGSFSSPPGCLVKRQLLSCSPDVSPGGLITNLA